MFRGKALVVLGMVLLLAGAAAGCGQSGGQTKAPWPQHDITIIVPYKSGGGYDIKARTVAPFIEKYLPNKVNIIIKNVPGADAKIGTIEMTKAKPDGYTLALADPLHLALLEKEGGLEGIKPEDLTWLGRLDSSPSLVVVGTQSRFKTVADMRGQNVSFATSGDNIPASHALASAVGAKPTFVSYNGYPEACLAVARGDVDIFIGTAETVFKQVKTLEGKLSSLLLIGGRSPLLPQDIKTVPELGLNLEDAVGRLHVLIAGPPNLDPTAKQVLAEAIDKATRDPQFAEKMKKAGYVAAPLAGSEIEKVVQESLRVGRESQS